MPGILRKISAVLRGADCSTASAPTVLTETLDLSLVVAVDVPVTNTESRLTAALSAAGGVAGAAAAVSWASAAGAHRQDTTAQARACRRMVCKVDIAILSHRWWCADACIVPSQGAAMWPAVRAQ